MFLKWVNLVDFSSQRREANAGGLCGSDIIVDPMIPPVKTARGANGSVHHLLL